MKNVNELSLHSLLRVVSAPNNQLERTTETHYPIRKLDDASKFFWHRPIYETSEYMVPTLHGSSTYRFHSPARC